MEFKVMGTGSRRMILQPDAREIYDALEVEIFKLREEFPGLVLITGMAEGWDEAFAKIGLRNGIPYEAYIPNKGFGAYYWGKNSLMGQNRMGTFNQLVGGARKVTYCCDSLYLNGVHSNFIRNDWMIAASDLALVYYAPGSKNAGGTADAVKKLRGVIPFKVYPFN